MSNVAIFNPGQVPAHIAKRGISAVAKALAGGSSQTGKRISIKGGVFRLVAGGKEITSIDDRHLDVIIVRAAPKVSRIFYAGAYNADAIVRPDCWSNDGEKPDASIAAPQSKTCMGCPQNEAGSGNGNSRACRFQQRLAVVLANNPEGDVLQLTLPATSIFGKEEGDKRPLQAYARFLAAQTPPVNPEQIVTRMKFDTKAESPKLFFRAARSLNESEMAAVIEKGQSPEALSAIAFNPAQMDLAKTAEATAPKASPFREEAKPAVVEEEEPTVRKSKTNAAPVKTESVEAILDDWATDD